MPVPEHFVWLVTEKLCKVLAYLNFGQRWDEEGQPEGEQANWVKIFHRDLVSILVSSCYEHGPH